MYLSVRTLEGGGAGLGIARLPFSPDRKTRKMNRTQTVLVAALLAVTCGPEGAEAAGYATFDQTTDTISVTGNTILGPAATFEAVIRRSAGTDGVVWNEWQISTEDKQFGLRLDGGVYGFSNVTGTSTIGGASTLGAWHHYAYVFDAGEERLYIDGSLVTTRSAGSDIPDGPSSIMAVGAIVRNNPSTLYESFFGDIDSLRISAVARYSGSSFVPTVGDLPTDSSTLLLYNFNQPPGATVITDESGNGHTGTLGSGFAGATSPTFVPEPAAAGLLLMGGLIAFGRRSKREGSSGR